MMMMTITAMAVVATGGMDPTVGGMDPTVGGMDPTVEGMDPTVEGMDPMADIPVMEAAMVVMASQALSS